MKRFPKSARWLGSALFMKQLFYFSAFAGLVLALMGAGAAAAEVQNGPGTPREQYQALRKALEKAGPAYYFQSTNDAERQAIVAGVDKVMLGLLELVDKNPKEPFALDALTQVVSLEYWLNTHTIHPGFGKDSPQARAIALLLRDHLQSDQLIETCKRASFGMRQECETFLRTVLSQNPHREVQGAACLRLAQLLADRVEKLDLLKEQPLMVKRYEALYGRDFIETLRSRDRATVMKEAETFYDQASEKYDDVKLPYNETVGSVARTDLFEIRHLGVGMMTQDFGGEDQDGRPLKLSDYRGKVVLLYFWSEF